MKKFFLFLTVAVSALLVSSCGPKYVGYYKADLTVLQKGIYSTIVINEDGTASILNGNSQESTPATWSEYTGPDRNGQPSENCIRVDFDAEEGIPYIMDFNNKLISYGTILYRQNTGYTFQKIK